jgi:hypothetical protein
MTCDSCNSNSPKNECGVCCCCITVKKTGEQLVCDPVVRRDPNKYNYHCCSKFSHTKRGETNPCPPQYSGVTPTVKNFCVNKTNTCGVTIIEEGNGTCCIECNKKPCGCKVASVCDACNKTA